MHIARNYHFSIQVIDKMSMWICVTLHIFSVATLVESLSWQENAKCIGNWGMKIEKKLLWEKIGKWERNFPRFQLLSFVHLKTSSQSWWTKYFSISYHSIVNRTRKFRSRDSQRENIKKYIIKISIKTQTYFYRTFSAR